MRSSGGHREAILAAGTRLFHERGFSRTTTEQIAAEARITKRTLYRYIESKESLLLAIHEQLLEHLLEPVDLTGSPRERFAALIENYVDTAIIHRDAIRVFFEERKNLSPESAQRVISRRDRHEKLFRDTLAMGVASGDFRPMDVAVVTQGVLGAVASLYQWYSPTSWLAPRFVGPMISTMFADGLAVAATTLKPSVQRNVDAKSSPARQRPDSADPAAVAVAAEMLWTQKPLLSTILDRAAAMFYERGYDNTNTRELADAVGLTKSALYYYIPNKEALLFQLNLRLSVQGVEAERELIARNPDPAHALRAVMVWQCSTVAQNLNALRTINYEMRFLEREHYDQIQALRAEYSRLFERIVRAYAPRWATPRLARPVSLCLLGMMNFMNEWYTPKGRLSGGKVGEEFFQLVTAGMARDGRSGGIDARRGVVG
jgi:AcrR family transcriptional regulator